MKENARNLTSSSAAVCMSAPEVHHEWDCKLELKELPTHVIAITHAPTPACALLQLRASTHTCQSFHARAHAVAITHARANTCLCIAAVEGFHTHMPELPRTHTHTHTHTHMP